MSVGHFQVTRFQVSQVKELQMGGADCRVTRLQVSQVELRMGGVDCRR